MSAEKPTDRPDHPLTFLDLDVEQIGAHPDLIERMFDAQLTGVIVRRAFPETLVKAAVAAMGGDALGERWDSPNKGMPGGEIRTIGDAATPTFTAMRGPSPERYAASAGRHADNTRAIFGDARPTAAIAELLSTLYAGRPAGPPDFEGGGRWAPYNYRALDPGVQIYTHHDNHYGLSVYAHMPKALDRSGLLSWFVTVQAPEAGGELVVYDLWGSDPNPPMLPTRFLDTAALERDWGKATITLGAGDLIVFDAGRHVHRVRPVEGARPRLTLGGFLTLDVDRTRLAFWS